MPLMEIGLVPFGREDFQRLIGWIPDAAFLVQWAGTSQFRFPLDEAQLEEYLRPTQAVPPTRRAYKAVDRKAGEAVGHIELNDIDVRNRSARVARVLVGEAGLRRKGVGTQMLREVLRIGFCELGLHRIELLVFAFNHPAIACYEKVGFVREGVLRDARWHDGRFWDLVLYSLLAAEWERAAREGDRAGETPGRVPREAPRRNHEEG